MLNRKRRKLEHLKYSLLFEKKLSREVFNDVKIVHNCLSEINIDEIDISTNLKGIQLKTPIVINAITGGMREGYIINRELAKVARDLNLAMAVGSQKIAIAYKAAEKSFSIVRKINPEGIIFANIGADATIADAQKTVEMVQANALQLHLNVPQELAMREGRRKFKGTLENILHIAQNIKVPVIVKEVGFGMSQDEAKLLVDNKIQILDIGGYGGTNFVAIENARNKSLALKSLENWGIPTAPSLIEVVNKVGSDADIICSGGLETGLDVAKALALGAKAAALAGSPLYILYKEGTSALCKHILNMERVLKYTMAMSGANNILELGQRPTVVIGKTREWLKYRGIRA